MSMGWDLRDPFCLWATLPNASQGGLQGGTGARDGGAGAGRVETWERRGRQPEEQTVEPEAGVHVRCGVRAWWGRAGR